ncbi:MAG: cob(I)yrinic acid a,c-diamide adenosyltransferase [Planctomycetes bacterium]|nr:cob(I)yrinic acid a,c-diamide adenosyltransferase [Planctomycetota bacterium]
MKLYTKTGDDGSTGLFGNQRVPKCDARVAAYGDVDETNAAIGAVLATCDDDQTADILRRIQSDLFVLGGQLATPEGQPPATTMKGEHVSQLEHWIDEACRENPPLRNFVLPGGTASAASLHLARTVCRRAERTVVALARQQMVDACTIVYLNRLSDLLFALARRANHRAGVADIPWIAPPR